MFSYLFLILYGLTYFSAFADTQCKNVYSHNDRRTNKNTLRVMQYNMEWVFLDYFKNADCPGNGCTWKNQSDIQTHMSYLSDVVNKLNPDILNICEIEGCDELNALINITDSNYNPYLISGTDTATGQNVGLLTKVDPTIDLYRVDYKYHFPIKNSNCGYTGPSGTYGVSKQYITEFNIDDLNIAMIAGHLLAMPTEPTRCAKREAQAFVFQQVIKDYINRDYEIIFIGDLNDYDNEVIDLNNNIPTSKVLDIIKGTFIDEYTLHSVAETIPQDQRFSNWWDSIGDCVNVKQDYAMIDHILVTDALKYTIKNTFIYHGYKEYCGKWNSDHYPIIVDFDFTR